jgi:hypothetical protein
MPVLRSMERQTIDRARGAFQGSFAADAPAPDLFL